MKSLLGYLAGFLSLALAVVAALEMGFLVGLPFMAAALICLPPIRKAINGASNDFLTAKKVFGFTIVFVLVGFILIGIHEGERKEQEAIAAGFSSAKEFEQHKKDEQDRIQAELKLKQEREKAEALKLAAKEAGFSSVEGYQEMLEQEEEKAAKAYRAGDYATALKLIEPLAKQGIASAQVKLGYMYAFGVGVPKDSKVAIQWMEAAASQGFAEAQFQLGSMYYVGDAIPQDYKAALKWTKAAALQDYVAAQTNLGVMYSEGKGVTRDYEEAIKWTKAAAMQGDGGAQLNLGIRHMNGQGTPQDYVQAYAWAYVAKSNGNSDGHKIMDEASRQMTPTQLEKGQRFGMELLASLRK